jgi:predicted nucleic acid-binding protein
LFDTGAWEGLLDKTDQNHQAALQCFEKLRAQAPSYFYCTTLTIAETHRRLLHKKRLGYRTAQEFLEKVFNGNTNVIRSVEEDEKVAIELLKRFYDQKLTFTDAISMAVMKRIGILNVFTFDRHFYLLGFQIIPSF